MKRIWIPMTVIMLTLALSTAGLADKVNVTDDKTGVYFEVTISSEGKPSVTWKNWRDSGKYYGEANIEGNLTIIIIRDGFSYSLSPDIKVARKSKINTDPEKNPMASKYAPLADIAQLNPETYGDLVRNLGARLQGPTMVGNTPAEIYAVEIPSDENFPWSNLQIWLERDSKLPIQIKYTDSNEQRTLTFDIIQTGTEISPSRFDVPEGYKTITFEWD